METSTFKEAWFKDTNKVNHENAKYDVGGYVIKQSSYAVNKDISNPSSYVAIITPSSNSTPCKISQLHRDVKL